MFTLKLMLGKGSSSLAVVSFTRAVVKGKRVSASFGRKSQAVKIQTPHMPEGRCGVGRALFIGSGAVTLFEFFAAATRARIVAANVFQRIAHRLLMGVTAVRAMHMTGTVVMGVIMLIMIVVAVWAVNVGLLGHCSITLE